METKSLESNQTEDHRPGSNFLGVAIDLFAIVSIRGYILSPVHDWTLAHLNLFLWMLPILYSLVMGIWLGKMMAKEKDTEQWVAKWKLGKFRRGIFLYSVGCVILFGWFSGIGWPCMMMFDTTGKLGLLYMFFGLAGPGFVAMCIGRLEEDDPIDWGIFKYITKFVSLFKGKRNMSVLILLTVFYTVLMECSLFSGPRTNSELGLTMSVLLALVAFIPTRLLIYYLHSRNPWELVTLTISSAHLIYLLITEPGILNYGVGFDSL